MTASLFSVIVSHFLLGIRQADEQSRRGALIGNSLAFDCTTQSQSQAGSLQFASFVQGMDQFLPDNTDHENFEDELDTTMPEGDAGNEAPLHEPTAAVPAEIDWECSIGSTQ